MQIFTPGNTDTSIYGARSSCEGPSTAAAAAAAAIFTSVCLKALDAPGVNSAAAGQTVEAGVNSAAAGRKATGLGRVGTWWEAGEA
jgi:hypothetical protein